LGLWEAAPEERRPGRLRSVIEPRFNRAVIFDTTQESWHGLIAPVTAPNGLCRRSIGIYYLSPAPEQTERRYKALYAPTADQVGDGAVAALIARRANAEVAASVWRWAP
jgi:hypothetical protein